MARIVAPLPALSPLHGSPIEVLAWEPNLKPRSVMAAEQDAAAQTRRLPFGCLRSYAARRDTIDPEPARSAQTPAESNRPHPPHQTHPPLEYALPGHLAAVDRNVAHCRVSECAG